MVAPVDSVSTLGRTRERLTDGDAYDVIKDLRSGDSLTEETLRRFANWANDIAEKLGWILDEAVCKRCHGALNTDAVCAPCVYRKEAA